MSFKVTFSEKALKQLKKIDKYTASLITVKEKYTRVL